MCEATIAAAAQGGDGAAAECACAAGWRGLRCENPTGCDGSPCGAHGTCTATAGSHTCACEDGWSGDGCETSTICQPPSCWPEIYRFTGTVQYTEGQLTHEHIPGDFKKTTVTCVLCCLPCMCQCLVCPLYCAHTHSMIQNILHMQ